MFDNDSEDNKKYKLIKPHTKQKFIFIGGIFFLLSKIVKRKFVFIDLYCGEGLCKFEGADEKNDDEEILGSPLLLLDKFNDENHSKNLEKLICNDKDQSRIETLKHWVRTKYPNLEDKVQYLNLDAQDVWKEIMYMISPNEGIIILADPDNISTMMPFKLLKIISQFKNKEFFNKKPFNRRPELIINFMQYGIARNWETISSNKLSEITGIPIMGIEDIRNNKKGKEFADEILELYKENIRKLGYCTVISYPVLNVENNTEIYHMILASNHPSALGLYKKITKWAEETKSLNIITEKAHKKGQKTLDEYPK